MTNIFVGNLNFQTTQDELYATFAQFGQVERVNIVTDRETGQPRGFAFVEMADRQEAENAINQLNGATLNGRTMNVNEARPKPAGGGGDVRSGARAAEGAEAVGVAVLAGSCPPDSGRKRACARAIQNAPKIGILKFYTVTRRVPVG